jgi:hypothetical protein
MKLPMLRFAAFLLPVVALLAGCHSSHIDMTVENRTGAPIELLEVDYPSASFGADTLAAGAEFRYRIQVRLNGAVKVQYTESTTREVRQITGPKLYEGQQGRFTIMLLPAGKAEFRPDLTAQP